jgi:hypothetical protein
MITLRARFDGQQIEVPPELRGSAPGEVLVVYPANESTAELPPASRPSIWDVVGKAERQRTAADINAQVRADRDSWDAE